MNRRLFYISVVHTVFSQYGDIMSAVLNLMNVPIKKFFKDSINNNYGTVSTETFEMFFSVSSSSMFIGLMLGFALMGPLMDKVGRKQTGVYIRGALAILGSICMVASKLINRCELYILGHVLAGFVNAFKVVLIIYIGECCPDKNRGLISMAINSGAVVAVMIATPLCLPSLLGTDDLWCFLPFLCVGMAIIHICLSSNFPQSPKQLYIQYNEEEEARNALEFYFDESDDIDGKLIEMEMEKKFHSGKSASILHVLRHKKDRKILFLVLICAFVPVFSAVNIKIPYLVSLLISYGLDQTAATTAMTLINAASLPVSFIAPYLIKKFGRRPLFVGITVLCSFEWLLFAFAQTILDGSSQGSMISWLSACFAAVIGQSAINLGLLIMSPILISEICPHHTRAAISQFTQVVPIAFAVVNVALFPSYRTTFGASPFYFFSIGCAALAIALNILLVNEKPKRNVAYQAAATLLLRRKSVTPPPSYGSLQSSEASSSIDLLA